MDRSHVNGILSKRLDDYMVEASNDLSLTEMNIHEKSLLRSSYGAKWCRYSFEEEKYLKKLQSKIDELKEEVKKKLFERKKIAIENADPNAARLISVEAQKIVTNSAEFKQLRSQIVDQEEIIRFIDETKKLIGMFGYDIKNAVDVLKLEQI